MSLPNGSAIVVNFVDDYNQYSASFSVETIDTVTHLQLNYIKANGDYFGNYTQSLYDKLLELAWGIYNENRSS